ncbi:MAG: hypothetical protein LBK27_08455, partial [Treponema sp.]|nr:hypothetical protein [Treponema sp.]
MSIPEAGADAINLAELLADIDEFLPVENLTLSPAVSLYFDENLPQGIESLKLTAETNNGATKRHLLQGADIQGFAPLANLDQRAPVLTGNEYSGPLPPAALSL